MTNGVFAMPKVKVQRQVFWLETTRVVQVSERASTFFYNSTMSEAKEAIIREDESEGDDTEELYQSAFTKTEETCPFAR